MIGAATPRTGPGRRAARRSDPVLARPSRPGAPRLLECRPALLALPLLVLALAFGPRPGEGAGLTVRRVPAPVPPAKADARRAARPVAPATGLAADASRLPEWLRIQGERQRQWRAFPDQVGTPGVEPTRERWIKGPGGTAMRAAAVPETLNVAIIRIDFLHDRGGAASSGDGRFDLTNPGAAAPAIDRPPHDRRFYLKHLEALRRYYRAQSYGKVEIAGDVWPRQPGQSRLAYSLNDMADLGPWRFGRSIYRAAADMFRSMMVAADSQAIALGDSIPWRKYDRIILIHAGSDLQSDLRQDSKEDIPTFTITVDDTDRVALSDGTVVGRGAIIPETINQDGYYGTINGVLAHECGHLFFRLDDLYNIESGLPVVGYWSLMDSGNLVGAVIQQPGGDELFATGLLPPSIDPFQRFFVSDSVTLALESGYPEASLTDTTVLLDSERHRDFRRVTLTSDEYLLLENRYLTPIDTLTLDQDDTTRVILGTNRPDAYEYDALLPGGGVLVWHIDESVIPFTSSLRANPDLGFNTNPLRLGVSVIEADGLADLGDLGSPFLLGSYRDPWYLSNNPTLGDTTEPNLLPHVRTRPHLRIDFPSEPGAATRFVVRRAWQLPGFPIAADFPAGGPQLLAVDADGTPGDPALEVCWAGGSDSIAAYVGGELRLVPNPDRDALFAVKLGGGGLVGPSHVFARLDGRPRPPLAAIPVGGGPAGTTGPSLFAVSTHPTGADLSSPGGRVWLFDHAGQPVPGWPAGLPSLVTTPPVIAGTYPDAQVFVGCADGSVRAIGLDGTVLAASPSLGGPIRGRLAAVPASGIPLGNGSLAVGVTLVAAGDTAGNVGVFAFDSRAAAIPPPGGPLGAFVRGWPKRVGGAGFEPDFLWVDFDGKGPAAGNPSGCTPGVPELVVHHADRLWAYCAEGRPLSGWGQAGSDTLVASLGAGDPDGDGYPEVLTQTLGSRVAFRNLSGYPSPGWPRAGSAEGELAENPDLTYPYPPARFPTSSPPLALDVDGDGRSEVVALNTSGIIAALRGDGGTPEGWPLATGAGAGGAPVAADLDGDGNLEIVAPDRHGLLFAYSLPVPASAVADAWPVMGGDPGRTAALPSTRMGVTGPPSAGPLVRGSLKVFPNPARRRPVAFAYQLSEPAAVEFRILDTSGHEVASFSRDGRRSDNLEVWDPGPLPAGLYLARVRFRSAGHEALEVLPLGLIR
jgi:M6 family metalloprotease-like protein